MVVELYLDNAHVGCGLRRFVVLGQGPKWVTLFYAPLLAQVKIERKVFDHSAHPANASRRLRSLILANVRAARRRKSYDGGKAAKEALRILRSK
jgi:hypothetical protein